MISVAKLVIGSKGDIHKKTTTSPLQTHINRQQNSTIKVQYEEVYHLFSDEFLILAPQGMTLSK